MMPIAHGGNAPLADLAVLLEYIEQTMGRAEAAPARHVTRQGPEAGLRELAGKIRANYMSAGNVLKGLGTGGCGVVELAGVYSATAAQILASAQQIRDISRPGILFAVTGHSQIAAEHQLEKAGFQMVIESENLRYRTIYEKGHNVKLWVISTSKIPEAPLE